MVITKQENRSTASREADRIPYTFHLDPESESRRQNMKIGLAGFTDHFHRKK